MRPKQQRGRSYGNFTVALMHSSSIFAKRETHHSHPATCISWICFLQPIAPVVVPVAYFPRWWFRSCSVLNPAVAWCLRTRAHTSTSPALILSLSALNHASTRPDLARVRLRVQPFFSRPPSPNAAPAARSVPSRVSPPLPAPLLSTYLSLHTAPTGFVDTPELEPHRLTLFVLFVCFVRAVPVPL